MHCLFPNRSTWPTARPAEEWALPQWAASALVLSPPRTASTSDPFGWRPVHVSLLYIWLMYSLQCRCEAEQRLGTTGEPAEGAQSGLREAEVHVGSSPALGNFRDEASALGMQKAGAPRRSVLLLFVKSEARCVKETVPSLFPRVRVCGVN